MRDGLPSVAEDKDLATLFEACKANQVMLVVDITSSFSILNKEKNFGLKNCDLIIADLS